MKLKTCEYCGTEYNSELAKCPLCGKTAGSVEEASARLRSRGGARVAPKGGKRAKKQQNPERVPRWMWGVICIILGLAVVIGLVYFLVSMGYVGDKEQKTAMEQAVVKPVEDTTASEEVPQLPEEEKKPEEELPADIPCIGLTLSQDGIYMDQQNGTVYLTAIPLPENCTDSVVFHSEDERIATVDQDGMITAIAEGETEIIVTCGSIVGQCFVLCSFEKDTSEEMPEEEEPPTGGQEAPEAPEEVLTPSLNLEDFTMFRPGEEVELKVANAPDGANITYVSSDNDVATVSGTGIVTAVGNGMATITVMVNDVKLTCIARCNLAVTTENNGGDTEKEPVSGPLQLFNPLGNATDVTLNSLGESFALSLVDANGNPVSSVSWSTSNGNICTVDASGRVSAVGSGTATITATYNGQTYTCIVRCNF